MIKNYITELVAGINKMLKEFFKKDTNKKQRANMWTFSRLLLSIIIPIFTSLFVILGAKELLILAGVTTGLGALTDFFDGRSARKYNSSSEFGKKLDQAADKVFSLMVGLSLSILEPIFIIPIIGEVSIAAVNASYLNKNKDLKLESSKLGKIKQWPLSISYVLGLFSLIKPQIMPLVYITILTTGLMQAKTAYDYNKINKEELEKINNKPKEEHKKVTKENTKQLTKEDQLEKQEQLNKLYNTSSKPKVYVKKRFHQM